MIFRFSSSAHVTYPFSHQHRTENHQYQQAQFQMDDEPQVAALRRADFRRYALLEQLVPFQEGEGRVNRNQPDDQEQDHLGEEGRALHVVVRAFFKIHHAQGAEQEHHAGGCTVDGVVALDFFRRVQRQRLLEHQHFGGQDQHDGQEGDVMEECNYSVH